MIITRNTNTAPYDVYPYMQKHGVIRDSRNGKVLSVPHPVTICYNRPQENVNFCHVRNANPFFHFMEMLWFLEGVGDTFFITNYLKNMAQFSDNGHNFNAHYGYNVRKLFGYDQLTRVAAHIRVHPDTRRAVVQIWNPQDLNKNSKDLGCNTQLIFTVYNDKLDMTVFNRSNDAIWGGVMGANITNLYIFQAWVAAATGLPVGRQFVVSNNLHLYLDNPQTAALLDKYTNADTLLDPYPGLPWSLLQTGENVRMLDSDILCFLHWLRKNDFDPTRYQPTTALLKEVAKPLALAHYAFKRGNLTAAMVAAQDIAGPDWRIACTNWLRRKMK